jgi:hypothetical protein
MEFNMATVQVDGSSAVTTQSTRNNGGAMIQSGSNAAGIVDQVNLGSHYGLGAFASTPVDGTDTNEANSAGTYAYNNTRPVAKRSTTTLSGVSNTALQSGAAQPGLRRKVNKTEGATTLLQTTAVREGKFDIYSGKFINNQTGEEVKPDVQVDSFGQDDAATPTAEVPGELTYLVGKTPVNDNYKAKTNY